MPATKEACRAKHRRENYAVSKTRTVLMAVAIAGAMLAFAPTVSVSQSTSQSMTDKAKSTAEDVSKWTQKQWDAAKAKWVKQKDKWSSCNKHSSWPCRPSAAPGRSL